MTKLNELQFKGNLKLFRKQVRECLLNLDPHWFMENISHYNYQNFGKGLVPHIAELLATKFKEEEALRLSKSIVKDLEQEGTLANMGKHIHTVMGGGLLVWLNKTEFTKKVIELSYVKVGKIKEIMNYDLKFFNNEFLAQDNLKGEPMKESMLNDHFKWLDEMVARKELEL